jgi:acetoacetyl-CoA synthetase
MWLFVVLAQDVELDDALRAAIAARIREDCSPRHVPDEIVPVAAVPRTLTGKLLEVPVKKLLMGWEADKVATRDALANPDAFEWFARFAADRRAG